MSQSLFWNGRLAIRCGDPASELATPHGGRGSIKNPQERVFPFTF